MSSVVRDAVAEAMASLWGNPGSPHRLGQLAAVAVEKSRRLIAARMGVAPKHVFFTSGASEANAWVLSTSKVPVVAAATEHPSVLAWADEILPVDQDGLINLSHLADRLKQGEALVSVMAANNETGVIQPVSEIAAICQRMGARFHCDATQVFGRLDMAMVGDWLTVSAHKFGGPRGIGAMVSTTPPPSLIRGGKQERGWRAGTTNVPAVVGFGAALEQEADWSGDERKKLEAFCIGRGAQIVGAQAERLPNTLSVVFSAPGDALLPILDMAGVAASTGSACSSGSATGSHVLQAMGISGTPVRFSFGPGAMSEPAISALNEALSAAEDVCE